MIVTVSTHTFSHSTDPIAAAVTSGFRPASFQPATRPSAPAAASAPLDLERLYPNLYSAKQPGLRISVIVNALSVLRRAGAAAR
jgi:hypothetical protein